MIVILFVLSLIGNIAISSTANNFEGLIIYERRSSTGQIALERYYFGENKLRIDREFLLDNKIVAYTDVFLFEIDENVYFSKSNNSKFIKRSINKDAIVVYSMIEDSLNVLDKLCKKVEVEYHLDVHFGSKITQERWVSEDLIYELPEGWIMDYSMVCHKDNRIVLKMEEDISPSDELMDYVKKAGYTRRAIGIYPFKFDNSVFSVSK